MNIIGRIGLVLVILGSSGCGDDDQSVPTHMLYGTITSTTIDASRHWAYIEVSASGGQDASAHYSTSCRLSGPRCDYAINFIEEGRYTVLAFIDLNDNASLESPEPDTGDLAALGMPLILWEKTEMNFGDDLWRLVGAP